MAALILPSVLSAQQRDHAATPAETAPQATDATTLRDTTAPKSLMGMVMAALIQSAEQQSAARRDLPRTAKVEPGTLTPPTQADRAIEQVAVQSEP
jgi:hypothetical protein